MKAAKVVFLFMLLIILVYLVLYQVVARSHLIEKIMALVATSDELALIVLFIVFRLAAYLVVPALAFALPVYLGMKFLLGGRRENPRKKIPLTPIRE